MWVIETSHGFEVTVMILFQCNIYWTGCFEFTENVLFISLQRVAGYSQRIEPWALRTHHSFSSCTIFAMYIEASGKIIASDWKLLKFAIHKLRTKPLYILLTHSNNLLYHWISKSIVLSNFSIVHFIAPLQGPKYCLEQISSAESSCTD